MTEDPDGSARTGQFLGWESGTINRLLYDVMPRPQSTSPIRTKVFVIFLLRNLPTLHHRGDGAYRCSYVSTDSMLLPVNTSSRNTILRAEPVGVNLLNKFGSIPVLRVTYGICRDCVSQIRKRFYGEYGIYCILYGIRSME